MTVSCDVLVVGAGPAGSSAARAAAIKGARTILVEKNPAAGMNIQCAESLSKYLLKYLPLPIPKDQLIWEMTGMQFWAEGITIERTEAQWHGYNVNRERFDKWLADEAVKSGAHLLTNTKLVHLDFDDNYVVNKVHLKTPQGEKEIKPKIIIGADGTKSTVARRLGVWGEEEGDIGELVAYDMKNLDLKYPYYDQIFLGDFAPGSYAYIMPKARNVASIGVGTTIEKTKRKLEKHLDEFMELDLVRDQIKNRVIIDEKSGEVPIAYLTKEWVYGNTILVGDAATQNIKPFVEGIQPGIICGDIAGKLAADSLIGSKELTNQVYKDLVFSKLPILKESDELIDIIRGDSLNPSDKKRHLFHLGMCAGVFSARQIKGLLNKDYTVVKEELLKGTR